MRKRTRLAAQNLGIFTLFVAVEAAGFVTAACASDGGTELGVAGSSGAAGTSGGAPAVVTAGAASGGAPVAPVGGSGGHAAGMGGGAPSAGGGSGGTGGASAGGGGAGGTGGASAGSGGSGGAPPKPSICDGAATRVLTMTDTKIDDFEGPMISPAWSSFNDVMPVPNAFSITQASGGAIATAKYGHYQGTGAKSLPKMGYGVGAVFDIAIDKGQGKYCVDISAFDGVSFWAKAAKDNAYIELSFVIPETNATKDGGDCLTGCYNHPRKALMLSTEWKQYSVTFASAGSGSAWVKTRLQELAWTAPVDADWDFSIDEIAFYKGTPPVGPVGTE